MQSVGSFAPAMEAMREEDELNLSTPSSAPSAQSHCFQQVYPGRAKLRVGAPSPS